MFTGLNHSRILLLAALLTAAVVLLTVPGRPAMADPDEDGGQMATARKNLEAAARNYNNAKGQLDANTKKQATLSKEMQDGQTRADALSKDVGRIAAASYRSGGRGFVLSTFNSGSPDQFLAMAETISYLAGKDGIKLRDLARTRKTLTKQRKQLDALIATQQKQVAALAKTKKDAEKVLVSLGGDPTIGPDGSLATASWAPRNPDGSWPPERCSVKDPTTSGCITPRMLHAYQEARNAGFTRFTSCYRSEEDGGEHPRGRACDFSVTQNGFGGEATGDAKSYGNNLAAWFISNADRLGVLYVIWFRKIWLPGQGWTTYNGSGSPSAEHTNHVHLSVQ